MPIKKIVLLGPESTGKSTLGELLANHYQVNYCPEFARQFLNENGIKYNYQDLLTIAKGQLAQEEIFLKQALQQNHQKIFIDTDQYVMKVWCEYVFNNAHSFILEQISKRKYDLYLLCDIDLPWTLDDMREYPDPTPREELFNMYKDLLINQKTPWGIVTGTGPLRLKNAIEMIEKLFST